MEKDTQSSIGVLQKKDIPIQDVYTSTDYTMRHMEKQSGNLQRRYSKIGLTDTNSTGRT